MHLPVIVLAAGLASVELPAVDVTVEIVDEAVRVEASYPRAGDGPVRFRARRFEDQEIVLRDDGRELRLLPGLARLDAIAGAGGVTLRYELRGRRDRVPLFVPDPPVAGPVVLRVRGLAGERDARGGFPRLELQPDGSWTGRLDHLPSFLRLPPARGRWTVQRLAEAAVVLLVTAATAGWLFRRSRSRRSLVGSPPSS